MISKKKSKKNKKSSKIELEFGKWLSKTLGLKLINQFQIDNKKYDFKIYDLPILIEFHGDYFHANPIIYEKTKLNKMQISNKYNDAYKLDLASRNGYELFYVWENDYKKNKELIISSLKKIIKQKSLVQNIDP